MTALDVSATTQGGGPPVTPSHPTSGAGSSSGGTRVQQAQATLLADQHKTDADQRQATADSHAAIAACDSSSSTAGATATIPPAAPGSAAPAVGPGGPLGTQSCSKVLTQVSADQGDVTADLTRVTADETALATALSDSTGSSGKVGSTTTPSTSPTDSSATGGAAGTGTTRGSASTTPSGGSSSSVVTPEQLDSDQASIDLANADLSAVQQDLADADLVSPITGTVASISVHPGSSVSSGSSAGPASDAAIVVLGPGSFVVTTEVDVSEISEVTVGQQATITPDTTNRPLAGTVTSIGLVGTTSSGSTTYPVDLSIADGNGLQVLSGSDAAVGIVTKQAAHVITVPSSAVRTIGTNHLVNRYANGNISTARATEGIVGDVLTEITAGITRGSQVVLANLDEAIPGLSTTSTARTGFAGSGFRGSSGLGGSGLGGSGFSGGRAIGG